MALTVVVPTYRNPNYLDLCLKSTIETKSEPDTKVIVVVDGFVEESTNVLAKYKPLGVLELPKNVGMANAINMGVWSAETDYVLVINDDNVLCEHYDTRIKEELRQIENTFGNKIVLTVDQVEPTGPGMFQFPIKDYGQTYDAFSYTAWINEEPSFADKIIREDGHIFPFVVQKKWFMAIGGMDSFYCSPQVVDWDMFLKWELLGFSFPRTRALHFYHFGSVVTRKGPEAQKFREREAQAMGQFQYKWGSAPYNKPGMNSKIPPDRQYRGFKVGS